MMKFLKPAVLSLAVAATTLLPMTAQADEWRHRGWHHGGGWDNDRGWRHHRGGWDNGAGIAAAGIAGLAVGALLSGPRYAEPEYYAPRYRYYEPTYYEPNYVYRPVRPRPVYVDRYVSSSAEPWTPGWYRYCSDRYRTFNARTGTFVGYDGQRHFCRG